MFDYDTRHPDSMQTKWFATLCTLDRFVSTHQRLPIFKRRNYNQEEHELYYWIAKNNYLYKHRHDSSRSKQRMTQIEIAQAWKEFCLDYRHLFNP
jgi:hypothetical protein